jgi:hypothetical protein
VTQEPGTPQTAAGKRLVRLAFEEGQPGSPLVGFSAEFLADQLADVEAEVRASFDIDALVDRAYANESGLLWTDYDGLLLDNIKADLRSALLDTLSDGGPTDG